jgi:signal transduction histidine kinase
MEEASLGPAAPGEEGRPAREAGGDGGPAPAELAARAARQRLLAALAPPVQHEVNNLLTVLFANVESLRRALPEEGLAQRQIERVALASRRLDAVVRAFTVMARRPLPDLAAVDPGAALAAVEPLLRLVAGSRISLAIEQAQGLPPVRLDRTLFDLGLLEAARDAVARLSCGGTVRLALGPAAGGGAALAISGLPPAPPTAALSALAEGAGGRLEASEAPGDRVTLTLVLPPAPEEAAPPRS